MSAEKDVSDTERKVHVLESSISVEHRKRQYTMEELQQEYDYIRAQSLTRKMLDAGLITEEEFNRTAVRNRRSFSPYLAEIMPEIT